MFVEKDKLDFIPSPLSDYFGVDPPNHYEHTIKSMSLIEALNMVRNRRMRSNDKPV